MLAAFPEDGPPFGEPITWAGHLHGAGFVCIVLFGMTGIVATAVALRRNVAWRGYSAISVIAAVAAFFFRFVLAFHQAPAHEIVCNFRKICEALRFSTTEIEVLGRVSGYALLACTPAVRGRRPSPALHARRRARHRTRPGPYSTGPVGDLAAMPTVTWPGHGEGRRAWIASVGGSDHVRSDHPPRWGSPGLGFVGSGPSPEVKARFLMSGSDEGRSRHVRAGGPFARSKTGCL